MIEYDRLFVDRADRYDFTSEITAALRQLANRECYSPYSECCYTRTNYVDESPAFSVLRYESDPLIE